MTDGRPDIPIELARWAAASLVEGQSIAEVVAALAVERIPEVDAARLCASFLAGDPGFEAARWVAQRLRALESVLTARQELAARSGRRTEVARRAGVDPAGFRDDFYATSTPVVLTDVCDGWPALSLETVVDTLAKTEVEILADRPPDAAPAGDAGGGPWRWRAPLATFVEDTSAAPLEARAGVVCDPAVLTTPAGAALLEGASTDTRYLTDREDGHDIRLWAGVTGSTSPLHFDDVNQLVAVRSGRFAVTLVSPLDTHCLYATSGPFSPVDPTAPDDRRYPRVVQVEPVAVVVYPGEALFVPVGWWHHVEVLETGVALAFADLVLPNRFELSSPDLGS